MLLKPFCALIADDGLNVEIYISVILCNIEIRTDKKHVAGNIIWISVYIPFQICG